MRILILSRRGTLYSTRRFTKSALRSGHEVRVLDPLRCHIVIAPGGGTVYIKDRPIETPGVVLPRIGASITEYGLATVMQFEQMGVPVVNPSQAILASRDKLRGLQVLAQNGIDVPRTIMSREVDHLDKILELVGGAPVIVKLLHGTQGVGVMIAHTREALEGLLETLWGLEQDLLVQEYYPEAAGQDLRILVVGSQVVAAMRRVARPGDFRSNIHRGGEGFRVDLPDAYRDLALRAAMVLGLRVAGVDIIESKTGPKVVEVNSSPGFEGLERATGLDIAGAIIDYTVRYAEEVREKKQAA
ncbi:MAG: RimK family alpha-L-glutamate ligase [Nitrospirae bacterium]|nr:RimK family alpha-L-glutamate ligase [Nitrospirota bacterium]